jgi:hypothetical protein
MKKTHICLVPFTGLGLYGGYRGDTWLRNRIKIFKQFVIPSMLNQSKLEFVVWIAWREEERYNPIVQDFQRSLDGLKGLSFVHTFGGCPFYDDKYEDSIAKKRLLETLKLSLPDLTKVVGDSTFVYLTIWPSDDMYLNDAVKEIQEIPYTEKGAFGYTKGYIMRYNTKEVAEYNPKTIPPFFTIMFRRDVFLDPQEHFTYTGPYESHEYVKDIFKFTPIEKRGFVVGTHGENISTIFDHPFKGETLSKDDAERVLIKTGNFLTEPTTVEKDLYRRVMKRILNKLPRKIQFFIIKKVTPGVKEAIRKYYYHNI